MKKIILAAYITFALIFSLPCNIYAKSYQVDDLTFLPTGSYYPAAHKALGNAKKSIYIVMYNILPSYSSFDPAYNLIQDLIKARKRGVKVKVILDDLSGKYRKRENEKAYKLLSQGRINVTYDTKDVITHTKLVIVDEYITIVGSANWTVSAFSFNADSSVLIKSKEVAREYLKHIASIKTEKRIFSSKELAALQSTIAIKPTKFQDVSTITGGDAQAYLQMGDNFYMNKRYEQSLEQYQKVVKLFPESPEAEKAKARIREIKVKRQ